MDFIEFFLGVFFFLLEIVNQLDWLLGKQNKMFIATLTFAYFAKEKLI